MDIEGNAHHFYVENGNRKNSDIFDMMYIQKICYSTPPPFKLEAIKLYHQLQGLMSSLLKLSINY